MDTRSIPLESLTQRARAILGRILQLLNEFADENRKNEREHSTPPRSLDRRGLWAPVDPVRSYRTILLDGPRGTGKTSLMLTLIEQWTRQKTPGDRDAGRGRSPEHPVEPLFRDTDVGVRVLTPLDFDPHPPHLHPYAWLVLAFQRIVGWLDQRGRHHLRQDDERDTLQSLWYKLYEQALIGWDAKIQRKRMAADLDEYIASSLESHRGWQHLREAWGTFFDRLLGELLAHREIGSDDLIVLPIDDLDLHPSMAGDLLRALRLLYHPRLVFLLTGHCRHLEEVLMRELLPSPRLDLNKNVDDEMADARKLAVAIIAKSIPVTHRLAVPLLTMAEAFSFIARDHERTEENPDVELLKTYLDKETAPEEVLATWSAGARGNEYRYRDVTQIDRRNPTEDLIALCLRTPLNDGRYAFSRDTSKYDDDDDAYRSEVPLSIHVRSTSELRIDTVRGEHRQEPRILLAKELIPEIRPDKARLLVPYAAAVLAFLKPRTTNVKVETSFWSDLLVTDWSTGPWQLPERIEWPLATPDSSLNETARTWVTLKQTVQILNDNGESHDRARFIAWCRINVGFEEPRPGEQDFDIWGALDRALRSLPDDSERRQYVDDWAHQRLPILAAPEYGLPSDLASGLMVWLRRRVGPGGLAALSKELEAGRYLAILRAFERSPSGRYAPRPSKERVEAALTWLRQRYPHHIWYRTMERPPYPPPPPGAIQTSSPVIEAEFEVITPGQASPDDPSQPSQRSRAERMQSKLGDKPES